MFANLERVRTENRDLRATLQSKLVCGLELHQQLAARQQELAECLVRTRLKNAMLRARRRSTSPVISFPKTPFTIEQLEAANSNIPREEVVMRLAQCISLRQVDYFPQRPGNDSPAPALGERISLPLVYQVTPEFHANLQAAQGRGL